MAFFACPRRAVTIRVTKPRLTAVAAAKRVPRPAGRRPTFRTHDQPLKRRPPAAPASSHRQRRAIGGRALAVTVAGLLPSAPAWAAQAAGLPEPPALAGIPIDFILFALTLLCVAVFHRTRCASPSSASP
jgi:hypothetical protein